MNLLCYLSVCVFHLSLHFTVSDTTLTENWGKYDPGAVPFKMIMRPRTVAQERGGASFKRPKQRSKGSLF